MDALFGVRGTTAAQRKRRLAAAAAVGLAALLVWRASRKDSAARQRVRVLLTALQRHSESLVQRTTACVVAGAVQGASWAAGFPSTASAPEGTPQQPFQVVALEKILETMTSQAGLNLVSLAVSVAAKNSITAVCDHLRAQDRERRGAERAARSRPSFEGFDPSADAEGVTDSEAAIAAGAAAAAATGHPIVAQLLRWASTPEGERFAMAAINACARTSTAAYMESIAGLNTYDDLFAAALKPEHREAVKDLTTVITREAVATYLAPPSRPQPSAPRDEQRTVSHAADATVDSNGWTEALERVKEGAATVAKQVRKNPGAAVMTVPVLVYATARGTAMGAHDVFSRQAVNGHTATGLVVMFDSAVRLFWAAFLFLAVFVLCAMFARNIWFR